MAGERLDEIVDADELRAVEQAAARCLCRFVPDAKGRNPRCPDHGDASPFWRLVSGKPATDAALTEGGAG